MKILFLSFFLLNILLADDGCRDQMFSFDVTQENARVKISDIIENLADQCKFSVKVKDNITRKLLDKNLFLVHINNYTLDDMLDFLLTQNNIFYEYNENSKLLKISYIQTHSFVIDYVNLSESKTESVKTITVGAASGLNDSSSSTTSSSSNNGNSTNSDNTTITTVSQFQFWDKLAKEIDDILQRDQDQKITSKAIINRTAGVITITGTNNQINRISAYLKKIKNRLHKQVLLEAKIFELTYADSENFGVDWSKFSLSLKGDLGKSWNNGVNTTPVTFAYNFSMDGLFDFLQSYGSINVLSSPKILTLNNQAAVINIGEQLNYRYQSGTLTTANATSSATSTYEMSSVFIGLTLNIVPEITDNDYIILKINPVISEKIDSDSTLDDDSGDVVDSDGVRIMPPDIKIKQLSSIIKAKDGNRVIIGGLVSTSDKTTTNEVPVLNAIPGVGWLFKNKAKVKYKRELIIVITPKLIKQDVHLSIGEAEKQIKEIGFE